MVRCAMKLLGMLRGATIGRLPPSVAFGPTSDEYAAPGERSRFCERDVVSWHPLYAQRCVRIGCTSFANDGDAGWQVSFSLSASFLPSATASVFSLALPGLIGLSP